MIPRGYKLESLLEKTKSKTNLKITEGTGTYISHHRRVFLNLFSTNVL
jgi:hypothetical protein